MVASEGHSCERSLDLLSQYMKYKVNGPCPDDWSLGQRPIMQGCEPFPRRRCFSKSIPKILDVSAYDVGVAGWGTGLKLGSQSKGVKYNGHRNIGIALFVLATVQDGVQGMKLVKTGSNLQEKEEVKILVEAQRARADQVRARADQERARAQTTESQRTRADQARGRAVSG